VIRVSSIAAVLAVLLAPFAGVPAGLTEGALIPHAGASARAQQSDLMTLPTVANGIGLAFDPQNGFLYAIDDQNDTLTILNGSSNQLVGSGISLASTPVSDAYDPANGCVYIALTYGVAIFNATTGAMVVANLSLAGAALHPSSLAIDGLSDRILVTAETWNQSVGGVAVLNGSNQSLAGPFVPIPYAGPIAFAPSTGLAYVEDQPKLFNSTVPDSGNLTIVDPTNGTVLPGSVGPPVWSGDLVFDATNGDLYATSTNTPEVIAIDPGTTQYTIIPNPNYPRGSSLVVAPQAGLVYLGSGSQVEAISASTNQFVDPALQLPALTFQVIGHEGASWDPAAYDSLTGVLYLTHVSCELSGVTGDTSCFEPIFAVHEDRLFGVTVTYAGRPAGTTLAVGLDDGLQENSTGNALSFSLWNGTYNYDVTPIAGQVDPWSGVFTVDGGPISLVLKPAFFEFPVDFVELGLPTGGRWGVSALGGPTQNSTTASSDGAGLSLDLANGSYTITPTASGFASASGPFSLTVNGGANNTTILFSAEPHSGGLASWWVWIAIGGPVGGFAVAVVASVVWRRGRARAPPPA
jgi:DNA-binding beta-propeller fold protein YncE